MNDAELIKRHNDLPSGEGLTSFPRYGVTKHIEICIGQDIPSVAKGKHPEPFLNPALRKRLPVADATHLVRAADPATSVDAAESAQLFKASHAERIVAALEQHGPKTAHELTVRTRLTVVQIDRRLPELSKAKRARVVQVDGRDLTREGFRVWEVVACEC
ncbi:hypothetical protein [Acidovorax sp. A1169]|uniref:hypothetical protein n=1 Tax=Acidovorax sp. A1169 TaxID=3059524 RepID=UPI002737E3E0|nr:hypothetical protein [Acidovorax sp. A1169]MDP4074960.1 hypothetical protein [Acidovorax sp. A1169]